MNKSELVRTVAERTDLTQKDVAYITDELLTVIEETLVAGEEVAIAGFGKFLVRDRAARQSINPRTKEIIQVPASKAVAFRPGKAIKEAVNK